MFESIDAKTYVHAGAKTVSIATGGAEKERVTFQLTASLAGEKILPMASWILGRKGRRWLRCFQKTLQNQLSAK